MESVILNKYDEILIFLPKPPEELMVKNTHNVQISLLFVQWSPTGVNCKAPKMKLKSKTSKS